MEQAIKHLHSNVTQSAEEAERERRIAPGQMVAHVDQCQRCVRRLNQARELGDQPQERSYKADAMRSDKIDGIDEGRDRVRTHQVHLLVEDLPKRSHSRIELLRHYD